MRRLFSLVLAATACACSSIDKLSSEAIGVAQCVVDIAHTHPRVREARIQATYEGGQYLPVIVYVFDDKIGRRHSNFLSIGPYYADDMRWLLSAHDFLFFDDDPLAESDLAPCGIEEVLITAGT